MNKTIDDFEEEDNTKEIAQNIFGKPPGDPKSIDLSLDPSTVDFMEATNQSHDYIRDIISVITLHGVEILFGHRNITTLSDDQIFLLKRYTRSFGFELSFKIEESTLIIAFEKIF